MKACVPLTWDLVVFWHVFLVSAANSVYNSIISEATQGIKRAAKGEPKPTSDERFMT